MLSAWPQLALLTGARQPWAPGYETEGGRLQVIDRGSGRTLFVSGMALGKFLYLTEPACFLLCEMGQKPHEPQGDFFLILPLK